MILRMSVKAIPLKNRYVRMQVEIILIHSFYRTLNWLNLIAMISVLLSSLTNRTKRVRNIIIMTVIIRSMKMILKVKSRLLLIIINLLALNTI